MEYKTLGRTDLRISRIGFGCWAIGGHGYGKVDDTVSIKAVHKALDLGINYFDTADVYGFGHSEEVLARALGSERTNVVIATKFGVAWDEKGNTDKDCSPKRVVDALEGSLRRLRLDCIPIYQIHWHDNTTPISDVMEALLRCRQQGKIKYIGCSNFTVESTKKAMETERIDSVQLPYNLLNKFWLKQIDNFFDLDIGLVAYEVLARGLLTGKFNEKSQFGPLDTRAKDNNFQGSTFLNNLKKVRKLEQIATNNVKSLSQVAIRWVLDNRKISCALIGALTPEQVAENCGVIGWKIQPDDYTLLTNI